MMNQKMVENELDIRITENQQKLFSYYTDIEKRCNRTWILTDTLIAGGMALLGYYLSATSQHHSYLSDVCYGISAFLALDSMVCLKRKRKAENLTIEEYVEQINRA